MTHNKNKKDLPHLHGYSAQEIFKMKWYEAYIEPEIRDIVKLLRDNGFNTTGSCGHDMFVVVTLYSAYEIGELYNCLCSSGIDDVVIKVSKIKCSQFIAFARIDILNYNKKTRSTKTK